MSDARAPQEGHDKERPEDALPAERAPGGLARPASAAAALTVALAACQATPGAPPPGSSPTVGASGTWTGTASAGSETLPVRLVLTDGSGTLTGSFSFGDPETAEFGVAASVTGTRDAQGTTLTTETGLQVDGGFDADLFTGTLRFPPEQGASQSFEALLSLRR